MTITEHERHPGRGLFGLAILTLPIGLVIVVFVGYGGIFLLGLEGRAGTAPMTVSFATCPAARGVIEARLADMGYAAALADTPDGFSATFDGPTEPADRAALPADLSRTGAFEVRCAGELLATSVDVTEASVRVDALMTATTLVHLGPEASRRVSDAAKANPGGALDFYVDGERVGGQTHAALTLGEVEIAPPIDDPTSRLRATAAWAVIIDHPPLPCPASPTVD